MKRLGDGELRRYYDLVSATVCGMDDDEAFSLLFQYINDNDQESKLPMTAPVVSRFGESAGPDSGR